jgi:hypothetical protein
MTNPTAASLAHASRRLHWTGVAGTIAACFWFGTRSPLQDPTLIWVGVLIIVLSVWPALEWVRLCRPWFPAFEIMLLTTLNFYALPLLAGHPGTLTFSHAATLQAAISVATFQAVALAAFTLIRWRPVARPWLTESLLPDRFLKYTQVGLCLNSAYLFTNNFTDLIPASLEGSTRAVFFGIGIISLFVQFRNWGLGLLTFKEKVGGVVNLALQVTLLLSDLYLIQGMSLFVLAMIGYTTASRRVPFILVLCALLVTAVLHNGKAAMRQLYWEQQAPGPTLTQLPAFFEQWFELGLAPADTPEERNKSLTKNLLERASLFQMLCLVADRVPAVDPYLHGETYLDIPALLIPRFLWPEKPSSLLANIRLALYFRLVDEDSATKVSIAFGQLAEAYANFGLVGLGLLGLIVGCAFKYVSSLSIGAPQFSAIGLFMILLTAWSFQVEQVAATWVTSLFQAAVVVLGGPLCYRFLVRPK